MVLASLNPFSEETRQLNNDDGRYLKDYLYFFELWLPSEAEIGKGSYIIPLVLNPEEISYTEPFAMVATPTADAGLYVEENGIIQREIRIRGNTGFRPRPYSGSSLQLVKAPKAGKTFGRNIALANSSGIEGVSGQKHFQFVQDALRVYADYKRDPNTAADTKLAFHNPRDDEHWFVAPKSFAMRRTKERRFIYEYEIDLLVYSKADDRVTRRKEDFDLFEAIKEPFRMVNSAVKTARGVVQDLTALQSKITQTVSSIGTITSNAVGIIDDAAAFVDGTANLIASPFDAVNRTMTSLDTALSSMEAAGSSFPDTITNSYRKMQDSFHLLGSQPNSFKPDVQGVLQTIQDKQELTTSRTRTQLKEAEAGTPPNSFLQVLAQGTANTVGDRQKAEGELGVGRALDQYRSAIEATVGQGDTLEHLAAKHLGDARKWRHVAVLNDLEYPYISNVGLPHTLGIGDTILIPSKTEAPSRKPVTPVIGVPPDFSAEKRILGTDLQMKEDTASGLFDFVIDTDHGSEGLMEVVGIENLKQATIQRLKTERGHNPLYRDLGLDRVVGMKSPVIRDEMVRFRVGQAVAEDPRIVAVRNVKIDSIVDDVMEVEIDAEVIGLADRASIRIGL